VEEQRPVIVQEEEVVSSVGVIAKSIRPGEDSVINTDNQSIQVKQVQPDIRT
jgi:hypothetical protein